MHQASLLEGVSLDALAFEQDALRPAEVNISGGQVSQALVVAPVVVVLDEHLNLGFEVAGQMVVLQQDAVLERLVPTLALALGLRVARCAADVVHAVVGQPPGEATHWSVRAMAKVDGIGAVSGDCLNFRVWPVG